MENNICHFEIPAEDLEATRAFYGGLFCWSVEPAAGLGQDYLFIRTSQQPGALAGGLFRRSEAQPGVTLYFTVADVDESASKLEQLGGKVVIGKTAIPKLGWTVVARDPAGNSLGLFQEDPTAG
jgi:predicted enzyme related to lactoylglutathione lyase